MPKLIVDGGIYALVPAVLLLVALVLAVIQLAMGGRRSLATPILVVAGLAVAVGVAGTGIGVHQTLAALPSIGAAQRAAFADRALGVSVIPAQVALLGAGLVSVLWGAAAALHRSRAKGGAR